MRTEEGIGDLEGSVAPEAHERDGPATLGGQDSEVGGHGTDAPARPGRVGQGPTRAAPDTGSYEVRPRRAHEAHDSESLARRRPSGRLGARTATGRGWPSPPASPIIGGPVHRSNGASRRVRVSRQVATEDGTCSTGDPADSRSSRPPSP